MRAISATGLLGDFADRGVIGLPDVHLARTITRLAGDESPPVELAIALTMRAWRTGSPCLDLRHADRLTADPDQDTAPDIAGLPWPDRQPWLQAVAASPLVGTEHDRRPLCLDGDLLYLRRTWDDQAAVVAALAGRDRAAPPDSPVAPTGDAITDAVLTGWTTVLTGGPGTGKTQKIADIVATVGGLPGFESIALAAPTGKAAARLGQALGAGTHSPSTLHRLLGARGPGRGFRYNATNPLPADFVIVDELSMVSLPLMAALLRALRPNARLLLVGDPGQLASVEAGDVLADLVAAGTDHDPPLVHNLTHVWRHTGALAELAAAAGAGDADRALAILDGGDPAVRLVDRDAGDTDWAGLPDVAEAVRTAARAAQDAARRGDARAAVDATDGHRLLCAHRQGPYGVATWARRVAQLTTPTGLRPDDWWAGRAVLATTTAPDLGVVSGDEGVAVVEGGAVRLAFEDRSDAGGSSRLLPVDSVPGLATLDAMTVHKAQGSQFRAVTVVLPPVTSPLSIRPLIYTAMTRASQRLVLVGTREQLRHGLTTDPVRASGLADALRRAF